MCYVIAPGNLEYPYSQTVWSALLATLNLDYISCASPVELLNSVLMRVDQHHQGLQMVAKLIFGAYVLHIWAEEIGAYSKLNFVQRHLFKAFRGL